MRGTTRLKSERDGDVDERRLATALADMLQ